MNKYEIVYKNETNLYVEKAPVIIRTRAIIKNAETGIKHAQLKFKNISNKNIAIINVKIFLYDIADRQIEIAEKRYFDLNVKNNEDFGSQIPIYFNDLSAYKCTAVVDEVCFTDGSIWHNTENMWDEIPIQKTITNVLDQILVEEFQRIHGVFCKYEILEHKDIWFCSCGSVNKLEKESCFHCNLHKDALKNLDVESMKTNQLYYKAITLINSNNSSLIQEGIKILESILFKKDCYFELENAKEKYEIVKKEEEQKQLNEQKQKKKKKTIISLISASLAFILILTTVLSLIIHNKKIAPYITLRDYIIAKGTYLDEDNEYIFALGSHDNDKYEFICAMYYCPEEEEIIFRTFADFVCLMVVEIHINKKNIKKHVYEWRYINEYGDEAEGTLNAKFYDNVSSYTFTDSNLYSDDDKELVVQFTCVSVGLTVLFFDTDPHFIGVTPEDLGFIKENTDE